MECVAHLSVVGALVHVFIQVLHSLNGGDNLDVDVAVVLPAEVWVVRNHLNAVRAKHVHFFLYLTECKYWKQWAFVLE